MSLFSSLKKLFNKNIECDEDLSHYIVFLLDKKKYLYINKNIMVRDGTVCVSVFDGRVCDVLLPGKYKINEGTFPILYSKAKVEKFLKKGTKIKKIRTDLYFVNTNEFKGFEFDSDAPFVIKSKDLGKIKGYFQGVCNLKVLDPSVLIKCLTAQDGIEKTKDVFEDVGLWIGNKINKQIQKDKITIDMIFNNNEKVNLILNTELEDGYDNIGLYVSNIKLKSINFPKRYKKKVANYVAVHKQAIQSSGISNVDWKVKQKNFSVVNKYAQSVTNNTMQTSIKRPNITGFKVCHRCGCKNNINASYCENCHTKF